MKNIRLILKTSPMYPQKLLKIKQPPDFLFAIGNLDLLNTFSISVVGARACCEQSKILTKELVSELSQRKITIISGMADGIDQIAHRTCLEANGKTIAILGCGFEIAKNQKIFNLILEKDGLILSEYFPDIPAFKFNFPRRNKILVAISNGVIAVETHLKSGTMITAKEALTQHTPLFTFPGGVNDEKYIGNNTLLTKGAICINSYRDVLKRFNNINIIRKHYMKKKRIPSEFKKIYSLLNKSPMPISELIKKTNLPLSNIQSQLTLMEIDGYVHKLPNNLYAKNEL